MPKDHYKKNLVSTIIPVHNRPKLVGEAVASVLGQTYERFEIVIVDDGSDDPAMPAALEACERRGGGKIRVLHQNNQGPGAARQRGLEHANGEFVQFLDSDDLLYPRKFESQVAALHTRSVAGVAYGKTRNSGKSDAIDTPWKRTGDRLEFLFPAVLGGRIWDTSTPLYRTSIAWEAGGWSKLINEEDWEFDCRIAALGIRLAWVDEWVSEQRAVAQNRASAGGSSVPEKLKDRARARHLILDNAVRAGVSIDLPEFQAFVRYSFLLARQCAAAGLVTDAESLVRHLNEVAPRKVMSLYLLAGKSIGFQRVTLAAERAYRMLRGASVRVAD